MRFVSCDLRRASEFDVLFAGSDPRVPSGERSFRVVECRGSGLFRPLTYALGAMNRGSILSVHAEKDAAWRTESGGSRDDVRSSGSAG